MPTDWTNKLYFGDNLDILRERVADESVDLIYLDPPFNSKATYSVLFEEKNGTKSAAQIEAFDDTWHWDMSSQRAYEEVVKGGGKVGILLNSLHQFLGTNDMMAYLTMMAIRLIELHRVLKPTGSIYLHCDPTASHYLKMVMDAVFGPKNFRNEIVWSYNTRTMTTNWYARKHDVLLFYAKTSEMAFNADPVRVPYRPESLVQYDQVDEQGRHYKQQSFGKRTYLNELGQPCPDVWEIQILGSRDRERLGYPTQKPEALLERIIKASSNEGDLVVDPFCGCGTTIAVAERLHRRWIGIDITHLAVGLMRHRLHDTFGPELSDYEVIGDPKDVPGAKALFDQDPFQFECWALGLVGAAGHQKGPDKGVDGRIFFFDDDSGKAKKIVIQVKGGGVGSPQISALKGTMEAEEADIGAFITLREPTKPMREAAAAAGFYRPPGLLPAVPRLQILTIEELLAGAKLDYPKHQVETFRKAPRQFKAKRRDSE